MGSSFNNSKTKDWRVLTCLVTTKAYAAGTIKSNICPKHGKAAISVKPRIVRFVRG